MKLSFREATKTDIPTLITLLADDPLGKQREDTSIPLNARYIKAFQHINDDPNNELIVVEQEDSIIGMLQLTFIPYLTHTGSTRCLIEGVRIAKAYRGLGLGTDCFQWAIRRAKERQCSIIQLTSNKQRTEALKFYKNLGFEATHEGFKLAL